MICALYGEHGNVLSLPLELPEVAGSMKRLFAEIERVSER